MCLNTAESAGYLGRLPFNFIKLRDWFRDASKKPCGLRTILSIKGSL